jgi:hypothetical protein
LLAGSLLAGNWYLASIVKVNLGIIQRETAGFGEIKRHLLDFIGTHTWEELCRAAPSL